MIARFVILTILLSGFLFCWFNFLSTENKSLVKSFLVKYIVVLFMALAILLTAVLCFNNISGV